jgi:hypothetical protein
VFTDDPPPGIAAYRELTGSSTLTKLQYVAWTHHDGDIEAAKIALGLAPDMASFWADIGRFERPTSPPGDTAKAQVDGQVGGRSPVTSGEEPTFSVEYDVLNESEDVADNDADDDADDHSVNVKQLLELAVTTRLRTLGAYHENRVELLVDEASTALFNRVARAAADDVERSLTDPGSTEPSLLDAWTGEAVGAAPRWLEFEDTGAKLLYPERTNLIFGRRGSCKTF